MRKGRDRGEKKEKTKENSGHYVIASSRPPERRTLERQKERIFFIVATNVIASRPPERRPTGTPHARANITTLGLNTPIIPFPL